MLTGPPYPRAASFGCSTWGQGIPQSSFRSQQSHRTAPSLLVKSPRGSAGPAGCGLQWITAQAQRALSQGDCASQSLEGHQSWGARVTRTCTERDRAQGGAHTEQDLCLCLPVSALDSAGLQTQTPETMAWQQDICCDMPTNVTGRGNSGIMGLLDILHHDEVFIFLLLICILQLVMEP